MDNILISIIINNYNYDRYLGAAIDSSLKQTYPHREIIVVDDGSTDDSRQVIQAYGSQIIAVLKDNGGQASAFNAGWEICRGDLVLFLDSDDLLLPRALESVVKHYDTKDYLGIAKLQYTLQAVSASGTLLGYDVPEEQSGPDQALDQLLTNYQYITPPTSGNVFPRMALATMMPVPEEEYRLCADSYLLAQAPFLGRVIIINEPLGQYRVHGDNYWSGRMHFALLLRHLRWHEQYNEMLKAIAGRYGFDLVPPTESWKQMRIAMMRYKLGLPLPVELWQHPFPIAAAGIRSLMRDRYLNKVKKTAYSMWLVLVTLVPRRCQGLIRWTFTHFYSWWDLKYRLREIRFKVLKMKG